MQEKKDLVKMLSYIVVIFDEGVKTFQSNAISLQNFS